MTDPESLIREVERLGGTFTLSGDKIEVEYPDESASEVEALLPELRAQRDAVRSLLYKHHSGMTTPGGCPPLPSGVRLKKYAPKSPPVLVQPWSVVTDVEKFIRACLRGLDWRLKHPKAYAAPPIPEILSKLAEVGVEVEIYEPAEIQKRKVRAT